MLALSTAQRQFTLHRYTQSRPYIVPFSEMQMTYDYIDGPQTDTPTNGWAVSGGGMQMYFASTEAFPRAIHFIRRIKCMQSSVVCLLHTHTDTHADIVSVRKQTAAASLHDVREIFLHFSVEKSHWPTEPPPPSAVSSYVTDTTNENRFFFVFDIFDVNSQRMAHHSRDARTHTHAARPSCI